jgi:hypothetical protein
MQDVSPAAGESKRAGRPTWRGNFAGLKVEGAQQLMRRATDHLHIRANYDLLDDQFIASLGPSAATT